MWGGGYGAVPGRVWWGLNRCLSWGRGDEALGSSAVEPDLLLRFPMGERNLELSGSRRSCLNCGSARIFSSTSYRREFGVLADARPRYARLELFA